MTEITSPHGGPQGNPQSKQIITDTNQPKLFILEEAITTGSVELFPAVWNAAQGLTSPSSQTRKEALQALVDMRAVRLSPLIAYLVATRLDDPDPEVPPLVVKTLADLLAVDENGQPTPEEVRAHLIAFFAQLRRSTLEVILNVCILEPELRTRIAKLVNLCPGAGKHLAEILSDRKLLVELRRQAADFIGLIGYVEAAPTLERLRNRIESRQNGQQRMTFAPPSISDEDQLLPAINTALTLIKTT